MRDGENWDDLILIIPGSFDENGQHIFNNIETLFYTNKARIDKLYHELFVAYHKFHDGELELPMDDKRNYSFPGELWVDIYSVVLQYLEAHHKSHQLDQDEALNK